MSAFICDKNHFVYLLTAALELARRNRHGSGGFDYFHAGERHEVKTPTDQADAANLLLLENIKSVSHRYPGDKSSATLPGPCASEEITERDFSGPFVRWTRIDPVQVLKSINCLRYQSCEHDEWKESEAYSLLNSLERDCVHALPGYENAEWGAPEQEHAELIVLGRIHRIR